MLKEFWSTITLKARSEQISGETTEINALQWIGNKSKK
jgi:hypothetical protein